MAARAKVIVTEVKSRAESGAGFEGKVKKQGWAALGQGGLKEAGRDRDRAQQAALDGLGGSRQQPRAVTNVGTFLKLQNGLEDSRKPLTAFGKVRRHRWSQGMGNGGASNQRGDSGSLRDDQEGTPGIREQRF